VSLSVLAASCGGDGRTVLTVYSPHGANLLGYYEQEFEKAHPDIDVQWLDIGAQDILVRVRAEKANPQADVWFGATSEIFDRAGQEGLLDAYTPTWAASVPADAHDAANLWYGTYLTPEVIVYASDALDSAAAPQDWDDLLDPRWDQKVIIRDPIGSGSMRAIWGAMLARSVARTGNTAAGWQWLKTLDAHTKEYALNPTLLFQKLGRQEGLVSVFAMPDIAEARLRGTIPVKYIVPKSGSPLLIDGIAIVKGSKHADAAKAYYEFVTSKEAITDAISRFIRIPLRTDIDAASMPEWLRSVRPLLNPMQVDRKLIADSLDAWMRYWDANVRNRGRTK
jgi:iron(III) transport system substrate-binding protein